MTTTNQGRIQQYVFVLWGDKFEEATAALFTTKLREAGLRVKVVGLSGQWAAGIHGLALCADLTLDQALRLAHKALCVVIPCRSIHKLRNDPRTGDLLHQAQKNRAKLVIGQVHEADIAHQELFSASNSNIILYPHDDADLMWFIDEIASSLKGSAQ